MKITAPRPGFIVGFALAVLLTAGVTWAAQRDESTTMATPVNLYGSAGIIAAQNDAGALKVEVQNTTGTGPATPQFVELEAGGNPQGTASFPMRTDPTGTTKQPTLPEYSITSSGCQCVLCGVGGDGGVITETVGTLYSKSLTDVNGSPARIANGTACVAFGTGGVGRMQSAGTDKPLVTTMPAGADAGLTTTYETCCAQSSVATVGASGPWYCVCPAQ